MWFKSKKQKVVEQKTKGTEAAILEAAKQILYKKDVEKNLNAQIQSLKQEVHDLKIANSRLQGVIDSVKGALK